MAQLTVRLVGMNKLNERLKRVVGAVRDQLNKAIILTAFDVEKDAKNLVRVDTGRLKTSIHTRIKDLEADVSTNVVYAEVNEYVYKPFMRPALKMNESKFNNRVREAIRGIT